MAKPPAVVKDKNGELIFEDRSALVGWTMYQLQRRALQDVGFILLNATRRRIQQYLLSDEGNPRPRTDKAKVKRSKNGYISNKFNAFRYQTWVRKKENDLIIGMENLKMGARSAWWADQIELGTNRMPRYSPLQNTVKAYASKIPKIVNYYMGLLNDESAALLVAQSVPDKDVNDGGNG